MSEKTIKKEKTKQKQNKNKKRNKYKKTKQTAIFDIYTVIQISRQTNKQTNIREREII